MPVGSLSIFFPAYNEEANIESTVKKAVEIVKGLGVNKWELIIVNDGSKDKTGEVADRLAKEIQNVRVVHQENGGYGMAVRGGFYNSKYEWIVYTDSDGQFNFSEITKFLGLVDESDAIWGYRIKRQDPLFRLLNAKGWKLALWIFFGLDLKDVDCGFKMVKKQVIDTIPKLESTRGGMVNAELAIKAKKYGFKISQVGVNHYPRLHGKPTGANIGVIIQSFVDLFKLWLKLR